MTDEQWVWLYVNVALDNDEKLEHMCDKCKDSALSHNRCSVCGDTIKHDAGNINPNFDKAKFEKLSEEAIE